MLAVLPTVQISDGKELLECVHVGGGGLCFNEEDVFLIVFGAIVFRHNKEDQ
jgi:hypothetical protein